MNVDYIIVGFGLAGLAFAETLERNNKSFVVYEDNSQNSSIVAGGAYNPVILKRFTPVWDAIDQLEIAVPFYKRIEKKLNTKFVYPLDLCRVFTSIEEQNNWFNACDKPFFETYLIPKIVENSNEAIIAPFGLGRVTNTGKIDTETLLGTYKEYLRHQNRLKLERFDYDLVELEEQSVRYKETRAQHIVFCEGFGVKKNLFFKDIPLREAKGELLTIYAPALQLDFILKASIFIMPLEEHQYLVGATFNWKDKTLVPTVEAMEELVTKLKKVLHCDFEVKNQVAGIRPTVLDRRPLLGKHSKYKQLAILNGLGTRGVMLAPKMAQKLYAFLEQGIDLDKEITIDRF